MEAFVYLLLAAVAAYVVGLLVKLSSQKEIEELQVLLMGSERRSSILRDQLSQARIGGGVSEGMFKLARESEHKCRMQLIDAQTEIGSLNHQLSSMQFLAGECNDRWISSLKTNAQHRMAWEALQGELSKEQARSAMWMRVAMGKAKLANKADVHDLLNTIIDRDCEISDLNDKLFYETMWKEYCQERLNYYHAFSVLVAVRPQAALPAPTDELLLA